MNSDNKFKFYISTQSNQFWKEIGEVFVDSFRKNHFATEVFYDEIPDEINENIYNIAVGGHEYFHTYIKDPTLIKEVAKNMVALSGEQPGGQWFDANLFLMKECRECWDITASGTEALITSGVLARHLPLGMSDFFRSKNSESAKEIDVLFMGSLTTSRAKRIADYGVSRFSNKNHFQLVELSYAKTSGDRTYLDNNFRNDLAARSKIILNYHGHLVPFFEWHRALIAIANKALFISDIVRNSEPLHPGEHYITATSKSINLAVDFFLENEEYRNKITSNALTFAETQFSSKDIVRSFVTGENNLSRCSKEISISSREITELLRKYIKAKNKQYFSNSFLSHCSAKQPSVRKKANKTPISEKKIKITRNLIKEKELLLIKDAFECFNYNYEKYQDDKIEISVVVSLYNYESTICLALDSLLYSLDNPDHLEIIVIDDCSTDDSFTAAHEWLENAPCRAKMIRKRLNTGFISSRNIGIRESSGEYIAVLDADNAFLPDGLTRLLSKAIDTNADACYGIIIAIDESGSPIGLLSSQGWDQSRLVYGPYIDAMALFKKSVLIELGMYDEKMYEYGWFGWEDYEFWLRMADHDKNIQFLPNFVALYRSHSSSMINETNDSMGTITEYLKNKYSTLTQKYGGKNMILGFPR